MTNKHGSKKDWRAVGDAVFGLVRVSFDTPRFRFEAYGRTREQAKAALRKGLVTHCAQYDMGPFEETEIFEWFSDDGNMWFADIHAGVALRDNSKL